MLTEAGWSAYLGGMRAGRRLIRVHVPEVVRVLRQRPGGKEGGMLPLGKPTLYRRFVYASVRARAIAEASWLSALSFVVSSPRVAVSGLFDI